MSETSDPAEAGTLGPGRARIAEAIARNPELAEVLISFAAAEPIDLSVREWALWAALGAARQERATPVPAEQEASEILERVKRELEPLEGRVKRLLHLYSL